MRQIKYGAILSYMTIAFNIVAALLYTPWMVRQIGDSQYALYVMATSMISLLMMDFGLGSATSKFIAEYNAKKQYDKANEYIVNSFVIFSVISMVIFIVLVIVWLFFDVIYDNLKPEELNVLKDLYLIVGAYSILLFPLSPLNSILGGWEKFIQLKLTILIQRVLNVILIIIALCNGMGVFALVLVNALTGILMNILQLFFVKQIRKICISWKQVSIGAIKEIAGFSIWLLISQVCQNLLANLAPTIIGTRLTTTEVTLFSLALTLERYVLMFSSGVNGLFLPKVSSIMIDKKNREKRITVLMIKVGKFSLSIIGCIVIGFSIVGRDFVILWMGREYSAIFINALVLMVPLLISSSQQIGYTYIMAGGEIKYQAITDSATFALGFLLLLLLTKIMGVLGASLGFALSMLSNCIIMNILYVEKLNIDIIYFYKNTYIKWLVCAILTCVFGKVFMNFFSIQVWSDFMIAGIVIVLIYTVLMLLIYFNPAEKKEIISIIKR